MSRLVVVGAGGHGREVAFTHILGHGEEQFAGFLDDVATGATPEGWRVLGPIAEWPRWNDCEFIVALNDPRSRRRVVRAMEGVGMPRWGRVVHPEVMLHPTVKLGHGVIVLGGVQATTNIALGDFANVNRLVAIGHDASIGEFVSIAPLASISGRVNVGPGSDIGTAASIRQGLSLGAGAAVGLGAAVVRDVPTRTLVVGNPARRLRELEPW